MTYYAYVHARPDTTDLSGVFYVGKGVGARHRVLPVRNRHHGFVLAKHGAENVLVGKLECSSEENAFELERGLIKCLRRAGVKLTNMTAGGEGSSGFVMSQATKDKLAENARKMAQDPEIQARRSAAMTADNQRRWSDAGYRAETSEAMRGVKKTRSAASDEARRKNARRSNTPEAAANRSEAAKARWADPEFRERMATAKREAWADEEKRAAMLAGRAEGVSKSWQNPETRNKRIVGIKNANKTVKEK